ncbi:hypothetical protein Pla110_17590 [Polystyrenella longa]|uniref:Heme oxygenase n=1 Tax=Polystyrenella longa TaxID=2528007 RepID=A0A518CLD9_9PLAN|nr:biliverdin-producing heme oxygenase [Polystyrenella longa]QDU80037.1 hypothetical protein Pla110_17590 [Polystyrenella longa]
MPEPKSKPSQLHTELRQATRDLHQQLDQQIGQFGITKSAAGYARYLELMQTLFEWAEPCIQHVTSSVPELAFNPPLAQFIAQDRNQLDIPDGPLIPIDIITQYPSPQTAGAHWGTVYVLEGSSMGARFLLKAVRDHFPEDVPHHFLNTLTQDSQTRWPLFLESLANADVNSTETVEGAELLFQLAIDLAGSAPPTP